MKPSSMKRYSEKHQRLLHVNALVETISKYGRRFFYCEKKQRIAEFSLAPSGHIYFNDDYTGESIYVAYQGRWRGFSHGGTMKDLVKAMAEYIRTGKQLSIGWIGPERFDDSNIWGYAQDEIAKCRAEALTNPAIKPLTAPEAS